VIWYQVVSGDTPEVSWILNQLAARFHQHITKWLHKLLNLRFVTGKMSTIPSIRPTGHSPAADLTPVVTFVSM
jgi:hypothetical protein